MKANVTRIMKLGIIVLALAGLIALAGCAGNNAAQNEAEETVAATEAAQEGEAVQLQIFAANSLSKAMEEVQALYTQEHPEVTFADTQYEASGTLNEMLGGGAYADILITASSATMDTAVQEGYVDDSTVDDLFTNELVIVAGQDNANITEMTLEDLATGDYTLAVGDANVPAGNYAKQSLSTTTPPCWISADGAVGAASSGKDGTFDGTPLQGKVTEGSSVGNVCSYANSGEVDTAIVYSSDVYRFGGVKIVCTIADDTHKPIVYPAAICKDSDHVEAAGDFLAFCFTNEDAIKIWQEWGFQMA